MKLKKYQMGGPAPVAEAPAQPAPANNGQDAAMEQIAQMAAQIIQELGPEAAALLAQAIMEMLQSAQGEQEAPVFKKGGKLAKCRTKKACGGLKMK